MQHEDHVRAESDVMQARFIKFKIFDIEKETMLTLLGG
jgi:hypothetical protein